MARTYINAAQHILAGSITDTQISGSAAIQLSKLEEAVIQADGGQAFTGDQSMGSNKLTNLANGTASSDAVNKGQLDAAVAGLKWKASVRVATTTNGTLSTAFANGQTVDGITLATNDRILIKNQSTGSENGIYVVAASGAPTRATDFDSGAEALGAAVFVEEGSTNADSGWVCTNDATITIGSTSLTFSQFTGASNTVAGNGLTKTGNTIDAVAADASITMNADSFGVALDGTAGTIALGGAGLQIADSDAGKILVGQGSGTDTAFVAISGDATLAANGALTLASTVTFNADFVDQEVVSGTINDSNTAFTIANTPVSGSVHLYLDGVLLQAGAGNDYTISGTSITMLFAPATGSKLIASYRK